MQPATRETAELEDTDPDCLSPADAAALLGDVACGSMVVVGDSVAAGIREQVPGYREGSFAERVRDAFAATRPGFRYENYGVRDLRLAEIRETKLDPALAVGANLAMVVAGGNDALSRPRGGSGTSCTPSSPRSPPRVPTWFSEASRPTSPWLSRTVCASKNGCPRYRRRLLACCGITSQREPVVC